MNKKRVLVYVPEKQDMEATRTLLQVTAAIVEQNNADIVVVVSELADYPYMSKDAMRIILDIVEDYKLDQVITFAPEMVRPCRMMVKDFTRALHTVEADFATVVNWGNSQCKCDTVLQNPIQKGNSVIKRRNHLTTTFYSEEHVIEK